MNKYTATEAKDHFGELIDDSRTAPVKIVRNNKEVAVVISIEEYHRLMALEDSWLAAKAKQASTEGYIGKNNSEALLERMLNAKD